MDRLIIDIIYIKMATIVEVISVNGYQFADLPAVTAARAAIAAKITIPEGVDDVTDELLEVNTKYDTDGVTVLGYYCGEHPQYKSALGVSSVFNVNTFIDE